MSITLHVYDADKLTGPVRARLGNEGEKFLGLDGKEYAVDDSMCVIADDSGPLGLGGVIGGVLNLRSGAFDSAGIAAKLGAQVKDRVHQRLFIIPALVDDDQGSLLFLKLRGG